MNISNLKKYSYVPYSGQSSYCVVRSMSGHYFAGVRVENASFPLTINAVQSALFCCLSEQERPEELFIDQPDKNLLVFWKQEYDLKVTSINQLKRADLQPIVHKVNDNNIPDYLSRLLNQAITINSDFPVAALLKTETGFISGVNIECSEWSLGLCAERVVIAKALAYGFTHFKELYIRSKYGEYCSPCGACRQVIAEHMPGQQIQLFQPDHTCSVYYCSDLLPYSFKSSILHKHG